MARDMGWSLSEKGYLKLRDDGEPAVGESGEAAELRTFPTETAAYGFLGLPFIEPELREDRGEVEAGLCRDAAPSGGAAGPARRLPQPLRLVRRRFTRSSRWRKRPAGGATRTLP